MKAGRELDALVAERVMEWASIEMRHSPGGVVSPEPPMGFDTRGNRYASIPRYSTDIASAWEVVEKVLQDHGDYDFAIVADYLGGVIWRASFSADDLVANDSSGMPPVFTDGPDGLTAPLAICIAALRAVGADVEEDE